MAILIIQILRHLPKNILLHSFFESKLRKIETYVGKSKANDFQWNIVDARQRRALGTLIYPIIKLYNNTAIQVLGLQI